MEFETIGISMEKGIDKFKKYIQKLCSVLEFIAAVLVLIAVILTIISLISDFGVFKRLITDTSALKQYLGQVFTLVIGIEFLGMLCRPNSENVIEVLIFLVARHMIVTDTTVFEDFVSVISVSILIVLRRALWILGKKYEKQYGKEDDFDKDEEAG